MIWLFLALLLILSVVALLGSYTLIGGAIQIILICALVAMVIHRIRRFEVE